ncbi:helix-turn-helix transcriptional regulator [Corynebacterium sp. ZY180755]|jgi:predicted DNA-binding transcriptional regulator AlpA
MKPMIIDAKTGTELWTAIECAQFSGTARGTFTSYAGRGRAPEPVARLHGLTLWNSNDIRSWVEERTKGAQAKKTTEEP